MPFEAGDRVRIKRPENEYTGCRGTIVEDPSGSTPGVVPLGYWVAIDGEKAVAQPFLLADLERIRPCRVRPIPAPAEREVGA